MIDRVCSLISHLNMPDTVRAPLLAQLRQVPEGSRDVSSQNYTLYRCAEVVHKSITPEDAANWICQCLYSLTVPVDYDTLRHSIRVNRNQPVQIATGEIEPLEVTP